ncbi:unnamed protein product [Orchesella dallaii]|uniref:Uncharacterized protein n=1 Tax=Orchesella dallaii TaxID=48710 RepID=A0ABP1PZF2_9HEXA
MSVGTREPLQISHLKVFITDLVTKPEMYIITSTNSDMLPNEGNSCSELKSASSLVDAVLSPSNSGPLSCLSAVKLFKKPSWRYLVRKLALLNTISSCACVNRMA